MIPAALEVDGAGSEEEKIKAEAEGFVPIHEEEMVVMGKAMRGEFATEIGKEGTKKGPAINKLNRAKRPAKELETMANTTLERSAEQISGMVHNAQGDRARA